MAVTATSGPLCRSSVPASVVIVARSGGAASGSTSSAVKRKRSSLRVVPVNVGLLMRSPLPSASTSPGEKTTPSPIRSSVCTTKSEARSPTATSGSPTFRTATTRE